MLKTAILFPGQGSQHVGMAAGFMEDALTRPLFEEADEVLGFALSALMREGDEATLRQTENAQPALLVAGYASLQYALNKLCKPFKTLSSFVAGHSLGEYTAVTAAGGLTFADAVHCVRLRGEAMAAAVPAGEGSMSAVLGLEMPLLKEIAAETGITVANDNAPGQMIVSGPVAALEKAEEAAKKAGAKRALRLNVAGPFHTAAMQPAAEAVQAFLAAHPVKPLSVPCVMNADALPATEPAHVAANLVAQITQPVRWRESMAYLAAQGDLQVVELGAGKVLSGLAGRCDKRLRAASLTTPTEVDAWLEATFGA